MVQIHYFKWCQLVMRAAYLKGYAPAADEIGEFGVVYCMALVSLAMPHAERYGV